MPSRLRAYKACDFQALAHPTRIAVVEIPRDRELSAVAPQEKLDLDPASLSQHLAILRGRQVVLKRKEGNQGFYSLRHPVLVEGLDIMKRYRQSNLNDAIQMPGEMAAGMDAGASR